MTGILTRKKGHLKQNRKQKDLYPILEVMPVQWLQATSIPSGTFCSCQGDKGKKNVAQVPLVRAQFFRVHLHYFKRQRTTIVVPVWFQVELQFGRRGKVPCRKRP